MLNLPFYIPIVFGITALLTFYLFLRATSFSKITMVILLGWITIQSFMGYSLFYTNTDVVPPRILLLITPTILLMLGLFFTKRGKEYIQKLDEKALILVHIVRIPVEIVLWLGFRFPSLSHRCMSLCAGFSSRRRKNHMVQGCSTLLILQ